jgi:DNA segregation ATPase FtsK/SpoIIIE, S-DNA-T family
MGRHDTGRRATVSSMELLLELEGATDPIGHVGPVGRHRTRAVRRRRIGDVRVEVHPDHTVAALVDALADYAATTGHRLAGPSIQAFRGGVAEPLDPADRLVDTGLVSGETVVLVARPETPPASDALHRTAAKVWGTLLDATAERPPKPAVVAAEPDGETFSLDVTGGPEAGRLVPLRPGEVTVGRSPSCDVVLDDPALGEEQLTVHLTPDGRVYVAPSAASPGLHLAGQELTEVQQVAQGEELRAGSTTLMVRTSPSATARQRDQMGQVPFNRMPYRRAVVRPVRFEELAGPPETPTRRRLSIAAALSPAAGAVVMVLITQRYLFLAMAVVSPLLLVYRHVAERRGGKRRFVRERADFYARVEARAAEVTEALDAERRVRLEAAPALAELARQATGHLPRLWERNRVAGDLLHLRLGLGDAESMVSAPVGRGDDALRAVGMERLAHQRVVHGVPITVDLVEHGIVGLCGDWSQVAALARALLVQAGCLQSPEDLVVAAALGGSHLADFDWLKWLPHVRSATSPLGGDHVAVGAAATDNLITALTAVVATRGARQGDSSPSIWPRVLVLVDDEAGADPALLSRFLDVAPSFGVHVVWIGEDELHMPRHCRALVTCPRATPQGRVRFTDPALPEQAVDLDGTSAETARTIARALAPLRDASAAAQTAAIPRVVPLLDVLGTEIATPEAIAERWFRARPRGLAFPLGVSGDGILDLDLVEHGPHTLIGGTSGAGKSELLQALVLSLAATYPPRRLNFLFVDYKGGATAAALAGLPHTVGCVTNLTQRMSMRALTSLHAELERRMSLLEGRARDLEELVAVAPTEAPPRLVIVVDEFAALIKRIPAFVDGIVDLAQRGRSLGIHLILATQRPTGVVNENILANTNLRISMRVLDPADSSNIIGSRDAADIPVPLRGRAFARLGPRTLVPFQCAWPGAPYAADEEGDAPQVRPFVVGSLPDGGTGDAAATTTTVAAASPAAGDQRPTHLDVVVEACAGAARQLGLPPPRRPWVEPLPDLVLLSRVLTLMAPEELASDPGRLAVVGLADDPVHQAQHPCVVDLEASGGLVAFGTGGTGKTTLLRTVAVGLAHQGGPADVRIYGVDFAGRALGAVGRLPHCGAIVSGDDVEGVARLLTVIDHEIEARRGRLATSGAESLGALRARGDAGGVPRIVLLVDGYSGFHSAFDRADRYRWITLFQRIVAAGRQVGVHCVLTADRRQGVPATLLAAVSSRLVLRMAGSEELTALGVPSSTARDAELTEGRGFLDGTTEVQVACVDEDPSGIGQSEALAVVAAEFAATTGEQAPGLPELPVSVVLDQRAKQALTVPLAMADLSLEVVEMDLRRDGLVVVGPPSSGRSTALATVARGVRESMLAAIQLFALGGAASPLAELKLWDARAFARASQPDLIRALGEALAGDEGVEARVVLFVDAAEDLEGNDVVRPLEALARRDALRLVVACEPATLTRSYGGWLGSLRRSRNVLLLQPESPAEVESVTGVKPVFRPNQAFPPGRGVLVANRRCELVQVGVYPEEEKEAWS